MDTIFLTKQSLMKGIIQYGRMIKFSHTIFALPFALSAVIIAQRFAEFNLWDLVWILLAMVSARSASMGFNRIIDAQIDADNPRTKSREIPAGKLKISTATWLVICAVLLFFFSAAMLGRLCLLLSIPFIAILFSYSYTKRFTWLSHIYLGFAISLAPLGAWIAVTKSFSWPITLLCMALMTYIAGFDILYACQDTDFDRRTGLHSIPAHFGTKGAFKIARLLHLSAFCLFLVILAVFDMGPIYLAAVGIIGVLLIIEHHLVKPDDLRHIQIAFFHVNSLISMTLLAGVLGDELMRRWL